MTTLTQATQIVNFTFEQSPIRIIDQNGEFWFVANDVCNILEIQNTSDALKTLDDDEKAKLENTPRFNLGLHKGVKQINIINESGLYALILRSRKAMQKGTVQHKFRKWVTSEVLPSIRKTGQYRHTVSEDQAHAISKAIKIKCGHQRTHYQTIYHALYDAFGVTSYKELLASDFDAAMAFIAEFGLPTHSEQNAFWQMVGLLEHERISGEIRQLNDTINQAERLIRQARVQINQLNTGTGLLYDAFGEQYLPTKVPVLDKAQAFIDRQMAMKKKIGLIS
ncbi:ORF6C domain-containing protein [Moraxella bovis]|uniref:BRO family protein n=1 Tax=Moraxella bovis TaxID=476 RepID=UPI002227DEF6|nr:BRO family protein [Moraxella bovis]UYZ79125.1 ORF6C domain-containing protein [Moraxella bovis]UYZ87607.1 ORF6C domain-containing protein [Moraxella bovis]UYZ93034.1 ORF6C domain-containing protein [Moraxella bovis]UYZ99712.1 ORF6C domain-containing protein [Moraxella bovis]UZA05349.1 ORF6C domain-containing protein [Moraxella bovis]